MASKFVPRPSVLEIVLKMNSDLEMITRKDRQQGVRVSYLSQCCNLTSARWSIKAFVYSLNSATDTLKTKEHF